MQLQHENLIDARQFCQSHNLQISFIQNLQQYDLIEITTIEETSYFPAEQLPQLEKIVHLYTDLGINMEGIDAIQHLLQKVETMQNEISQLKNKLKSFEEE